MFLLIFVLLVDQIILEKDLKNTYSVKSEKKKQLNRCTGFKPIQIPTTSLLIKFRFCTLQQSFDGRLELFYNRPTTIQHIRARRPIWYVVHFPVQSPLPQIKEIVFNQRVLCKALPEFVGGVGANKFVTEIRLHHVLYTGLASQIHTRPMDEGPTLDDDDDDDVHAGGQPLPSMPTTESPVAPLDAKRIVE